MMGEFQLEYFMGCAWKWEGRKTQIMGEKLSRVTSSFRCDGAWDGTGRGMGMRQMVNAILSLK